ncbi:hypothetical protein Zmor_021993 [Zophobas morio]|uniref:UDP-glucuronosyltransferase n=2 Tax=Zophobas morio TaxID=2755281 RepID=A0AA38I7D7_9CUCU|nr:hypothetical protein Zmor_021993 [Zophobas morio]
MGIEELKNMSMQHTEETFKNLEVQKLLHSNENFDLIIIDWFYNEATLIFGHIYKAPVIYISSFGNMALLSDFTGNVLPYSYVPGAGIFITDEMSFKERVLMTLFNLAINTLFIPRRKTAHYELLKRYFDNPPTIPELQENVALVLSNSHFSFETVRPYTPNIIPVGGFHVDEPKNLPENLQTFLDSAPEGVIFFSLGTQKSSSSLSKEVLTNILKGLGRIAQTVLWKYEASDLVDIPKNIKIVKWVPQADVLAHPNLKLFITHGGMLSLIESIHYRVPMICIPFSGDQLTNAAFIESREIGLHLSPDNITENTLVDSIKEVTTNPKYQEQINFRSTLLRQQPMKPLETAIYWTEHVITHKHANHLKPFATKLTWYKYYLIDVLVVLLCSFFILVAVVIFISKMVFKNVYKLFTTTKKEKVV